MTTLFHSALEELYALGIKPDWWKLEPAGLGNGLEKYRGRSIEKHDPWGAAVLYCLVWKHRKMSWRLHFAATAKAPIVKGFAVGRTLFMEAAEAWLSGKLSDEEAVGDMADRFEKITKAWLASRDILVGIARVISRIVEAGFPSVITEESGPGRRLT